MKTAAAALLLLAAAEGFVLGRPLATAVPPTPLLARRAPKVIKEGTPWYVLCVYQPYAGHDVIHRRGTGGRSRVSIYLESDLMGTRYLSTSIIPSPSSPSAGASALQRIAELRGGASSVAASIPAPNPCVMNSYIRDVSIDACLFNPPTNAASRKF